MKDVEITYNGETVIGKQFDAKLLDISNEVYEFENDNKTQYRKSTIEFADVYGEVQRSYATVYEKNYQHGMVAGETYMAVARPDARGVFVTCSHLIASGGLAQADSFGFEGMVEVSAQEEVHTEAAKADSGL